MEALKAQAVAARSYALADIATKGYICSTESCQVYKPSNKGGKWEEAVNATAGWVLIKMGSHCGQNTHQLQEDILTHIPIQHQVTQPRILGYKNGREGWTNQAFEKLLEARGLQGVVSLKRWGCVRTIAPLVKSRRNE